ncbi:hypothetical protein FOZ62_012718, partial [Perkinsus olseni]
ELRVAMVAATLTRVTITDDSLVEVVLPVALLGGYGPMELRPRRFASPFVSLIMEGAKEPSKEAVDLPSPPASESAPPQQAEAIGAKDVEMVDAGAPSVTGGASTGKPEEPVFHEEVDCEEDNRARVNVDCKFGAFDSTLDTNFDDTNGII